MFPPFPEEEAYAECARIIQDIDAGKIRINQFSAPSEERRGQGVMIGVLVCRASDGRRIVLKTLSGIGKELVSDCVAEDEIFVRPIVSAEKINAALLENDARIHTLTDKINALKCARNAGGSKYSVQTDEEKRYVSERAALKLYEPFLRRRMFLPYLQAKARWKRQNPEVLA